MTIGARIKHARKLAKMSQGVLAKELGVSNQAVSGWERDQGMPRSQYIERLSSILHVDVGWLMRGDEVVETEPERSDSSANPDDSLKLSQKEAEDIGRAAVMFMQENAGDVAATAWIEALTTIIRKRGGRIDFSTEEVLRSLVQYVSELSQERLLARGQNNTKRPPA